MEGEQAIGRSRGGATTKIHAVAERTGRLVHFLLTGGNVNDCTQGAKLLETVPAENVLGDKAYETDDLSAFSAPPRFPSRRTAATK